MAENAKKSVAENADAKKGRASKEVEEKIVEAEVVTEASGTKEMTKTVDEEVPAEKEAEEKTDDLKVSNDLDAVNEAGDEKPRKATKSKKTATKAKAAARKTETVKADDVMREEMSAEEFQAGVREQIENCKNELKVSLERSIKQEFSAIVKKQLRAANRRRRIGVVVRDLIILLLAATVGYFGWCLYDVRYFDWMGTRDSIQQENQNKPEIDEPEEVVKDTRWYINNYGYLFEDLQLGLNADSVEAYYLYSDDHKVSEIKPAYLLGMAYNKVMPESAGSSSSETVMVSTVVAADLRTAFEGMFGTTEYFEKASFMHGCKKFTYARETDSFVTENADCEVESEREIVEVIDEMYEEGSALYVLTTAAIYDETEASFYSFDNLFKAKVTNAKKEDLTKNRANLNRYQYQFKKTGEKYHFSGVVKLQ